jgi:hypothetical protein
MDPEAPFAQDVEVIGPHEVVGRKGVLPVPGDDRKNAVDVLRGLIRERLEGTKEAERWR